MFFKLYDQQINKTNKTNKIISNIQIKLITFVTSWYKLKSKFSHNKYISWIKNLLSITNNFNLIIFTNKESYQLIEKLIDKTKQNIHVIFREFEQFNTYQFKDFWIKNHNISTMELHKNTDWKLNMLWNEKIFFIKEAVQLQIVKTKYYGWCDIGYFRNEPDNVHTNYLTNWPNNDKLANFHSLIHYGCVQTNKEQYELLENNYKEHYKNNINKKEPNPDYNSICFAGGFFILPMNIVKIYADLYKDKLTYYFKNNFFIKDDQVIVADIIFNNRNLFYIHYETNIKYNNWFMFQRLLL